MRNYMDMGKTLSGRWKNYLYVDTGDPKLAGLLAMRRVSRVKVEGVYGRSEEDDYFYIELKIRVRDEEQFLSALEEMKNRMLICGHRDYEARAGEMIRNFERTVRKELEAGNRISLSNGRRARIVLQNLDGNSMEADKCNAE